MALVGMLGFVTSGDTDLDSLAAAVERALAGESVDFSTDRDDDFGRLCAAVGELAERAGTADGATPLSPDRTDRVRRNGAAVDGAPQASETAGSRRPDREAGDLRTALDRSDTGVWEWDPATDELHVDATAAGLVDVDGETFEGTFEALERLIHPEDRDQVRDAAERTVRGDGSGGGYSAEFRLCHGDGSDVWIEARGGCVSRADGVDRLVGTLREVTDRREATQRLRERERRLQRYREYTDEVLDSIDDVFYVVGPDLQLQRWNRSLLETTGYEDEEIPTLHPTELVVDEDEAVVVDAIRESFETGSSRAEARVRTKDGDVIPYEFAAATLEDPDGDTVLVGVGRDISERVQRERELERTTDLLRIAGETADVGGWSVDLSGDPPTHAEWTDKLYDVFELGADEPPPIETVYDYYHPEDRTRHRRAVERAWETGEGWTQELRMTTAEGSDRWIRNIGRPVTEEDDVVEIRGSVQDVTDRKERELALESLHETTRGLLRTATTAEAADLVVETGTEVLDVRGVAVYLLDGESNELDAVAHSGGFEDCTGGAPPVRAGEDSLVWNSFATGTSMLLDDTEAVDRSRLFADAGGALVVPIGDRGVFVVATPEPTVRDRTRRLAETLVATAEAAFDRIESAQTLKRRDAQLERHNRRLERQVRITDIIRRIDQSLVGADSREEVERTVCDRLVDTEDVAFAWIGRADAPDGGLSLRAWAGTGEGYLDAVSFEPGGDTPAATTAATGEVSVVSNVLGESKRSGWRRAAVEHDLHSAVSVPLAFEDYSYGVLSVYGAEPDAFGDLEGSVFAELGETIAHSINAVETRRALHAGTLVELVLELDADGTLLGRVATAADCEVRFEGLATHGGDEARFFLSTAGTAVGAVRSTLDGFVSVTESRHVDDTDGGDLFEVAVSSEVLPARLVRHGARPRSIVATADGVEVVADVPTATDVRSFVEMVRDFAPGASLASRRTVERTSDTRHDFVESLFDPLTDRQQEVLRTAYFAGFFEWPRRSTGEEVADMLGVSQPTVNRHLRHSQQRLLEQLFDREDADGVAGGATD
jgi:PAS domain S-box-containing protein